MINYRSINIEYLRRFRPVVFVGIVIHCMNEFLGGDGTNIIIFGSFYISDTVMNHCLY